MFFDSTDLLVDLAIGAGAYWLGSKNGHNRAIKEIEDRQRDLEIRILKDEIERLKKGT
jgi:hypothetical protein